MLEIERELIRALVPDYVLIQGTEDRFWALHWENHPKWGMTHGTGIVFLEGRVFLYSCTRPLPSPREYAGYHHPMEFADLIVALHDNNWRARYGLPPLETQHDGD